MTPDFSTPILQCDGFAADAAEVRAAVTRGGFTTERGPDGALYTGISLYPVPHWFERIAELVGKRISPKLSCFRINFAGELPHSWVHSDDICAKFASVLYLNPSEQCAGGTAFWRHKTRGIDRLPSKESLRAKDIDADEFYRTMDREWKELNRWERVNFVPMEFNRFITYPTCLFHSRFPFEGFGSGPDDGRLIWICFYDVQGESN
ncbi:MAG: DUF6445 family protein [Terriglobales bacterium]